MTPTTTSRFASSPVGFLLLISVALLTGRSCQAYQLPPVPHPQPQKTAFLASPRRTSTSTTRLSIGADFDNDIEAALGQGSISEYERDAEFYRKRNEAYYDGLRKSEMDNEIVVSSTALEVSSEGTGTEEDGHHQEHQNPRWVTDSINTSSDAARKSFRYVEKTTFSLLTGKPLLALAIFAAAGIMVAYLSGFFFLEGYIENWNPVENDQIPYWDDVEIHTIERALPPQ